MKERRRIDFLIPLVGSGSGYSFYEGLAKELRRRGYRVGFVSGVRARLRYDLREIMRRLGGGFHYFDLEERVERIRGHVDIDREIDRIVEEYGIKDFKLFYFPEKVHTYNENKEDDRFIEITVYNFLAAEDLFNEYDIGCVIEYPGPELLRRILYNVARKRGILSIYMGWSPIQGCVFLYSNETKVWDDLEVKDYSSLTPEERRAAEEYIRVFVESRGEVVRHYEKKKMTQIVKAKKKGLLPRYTKLDILLPLVYECYDIDYLKGVHSFIKFFIWKRIRSVRKFYYYHFVYPSLEESRRRIREERYLFYPLQYPRESRIAIRAPQFFRQERFVELVAKALPDGYKLFVKDHPSRVGDLPYGTIERISRIEGVSWLHPKLKTYEAVKYCDAVVTINNTPGFEALLYGKPVVTLGIAFYGGYGLTKDVVDPSPSKVREAILEAIRDGVDRKLLVSYVSGLLKASLPGSFYDVSRESISRWVDYILDFRERHKDDFEENPYIRKALQRIYRID